MQSGLGQQHRAKRHAVYPEHCSSALLSVTTHLYVDWIFTGVNAVARGWCQLVWHSSTEEQGRQSTLNTAAVHWCMVTANLIAVSIFIAVNAVA